MKWTLISRNVLLVALFSLFFVAGPALCSEKRYKGFAGKQIYTAHNIWIWPTHNMNCLNYKGGRSKIPVGTKVKKIWIENNKSFHDDGNFDPQIVFTLAESGQRYYVQFTPFYHPGKTIKHYIKYMFTTKSIEDRAAEFKPFEMAAIKAGSVVQGMSKKAVIASYGTPPERHTRHRKDNPWIYFINKRSRLKIHFTKNQATGRSEVAQMDLLHGSASRYGLTSYPVRYKKPKPLRVTEPSPRNQNDPEHKLKKLKKLYDKGLITQEEYQKKRQQILEAF